MKDPLIQVKELHLDFYTQGQKWQVVRGIDFSIMGGETVALVGESGSGKSSVAKSLMHLLPNRSAASGEIHYQQRNLMHYSESQWQQIRGKEIALIFQDPSTALNPLMKVGAQLVEGYLRHFKNISRREGRRRALEMLEEVGFSSPEEIMEAYPHTLSGGMRQRALIALALICKPRLLLADEPTSSLDGIHERQILLLLKSLQKKYNMSILLISHDLHLVGQLCDRMLVMYAGKIVESGSMAAIFRKPSHPYTQMLLRSLPAIDQPKEEPLYSIDGSPPSMTLSLPYCSFCSRCPHAMNICAKEIPKLRLIDKDHFSACHKHDSRCQ